MPAEDWELIEVKSEPVGQSECYHVRLRRPDGKDLVHVFPHDTIDIRAGEYDIDHTTPEGKQQVLDIILHENHGPHPEALIKRATIAQARQDHLAAIDDTKANRVNIIWSGNPKAKGKTRRFAQGSSDADPAQMLLDHQPKPEVRSRAQDQVHRARVAMGVEKADPPQPREVPKQYYDPAIRRRGLTVSLMDLSQE